MKKNFAMKKLYYSISEVSKITELEQYVLRYWETEFDMLKPAKNLAGNRIYTNRDIKLILYIKKLLRDEKYTIEGAKKLLKNYNFKDDKIDKPRTQTVSHQGELTLFTSDEKDAEDTQVQNEKLVQDLKELKNFLTDLLAEL
ncbi:MAG: MerR family transcriptional regulator [Ignavibacteria bacterium]